MSTDALMLTPEPMWFLVWNLSKLNQKWGKIHLVKGHTQKGQAVSFYALIYFSFLFKKSSAYVQFFCIHSKLLQTVQYKLFFCCLSSLHCIKMLHCDIAIVEGSYHRSFLVTNCLVSLSPFHWLAILFWVVCLYIFDGYWFHMCVKNLPLLFGRQHAK